MHSEIHIFLEAISTEIDNLIKNGQADYGPPVILEIPNDPAYRLFAIETYNILRKEHLISGKEVIPNSDILFSKDEFSLSDNVHLKRVENDPENIRFEIRFDKASLADIPYAILSIRSHIDDEHAAPTENIHLTDAFKSLMKAGGLEAKDIKSTKNQFIIEMAKANPSEEQFLLLIQILTHSGFIKKGDELKITETNDIKNGIYTIRFPIPEDHTLHEKQKALMDAEIELRRHLQRKAHLNDGSSWASRISTTFDDPSPYHSLN